MIMILNFIKKPHTFWYHSIFDHDHDLRSWSRWMAKWENYSVTNP